jgi:hypothetical protein
MSEGERWVDVVREGIDCVLRYGELADSDMIARRVMVMHRMDTEAIVRLQGSEHVGAQTYIDLAAAYRFKSSALVEGSVELRMGIQNLLDRSPPIVTTTDRYTFFSETGYSLLGDPRRRRFDATLEYRF